MGNCTRKEPDWAGKRPNRKRPQSCLAFNVDESSGTLMKHLPPTIKQLLKLRSPNPPPQLPFPRLNAILKSTLLDAKQKGAETAWLVLTVRHQGDLAPLCFGRLFIKSTDLHFVDCKPSGICWTSLLFRDQERSGRCINKAWPRTGGQYCGVDA